MWPLVKLTFGNLFLQEPDDRDDDVRDGERRGGGRRKRRRC